MTPPRAIAIASRHPRLRFDRRAVAHVIATLDMHAGKFRGGCPAGELSVVFLTDAALAKLHANFLEDPRPTDVITFAGDPALGTAGEICISADAAIRHVSSRLLSRAACRTAFSAELMLYLVHGWLHLAGYDDLVPKKKQSMRRAEARALELLRRARRLPQFVFQNNL
jgi:probable rRNA maturation factor